MEKATSCNLIPKSKNVKIAAVIQPIPKQAAKNVGAKISTMNRSIAMIIQICHVSMPIM